MLEAMALIVFGMACVYAMLHTDSGLLAAMMLLMACGAFTWAADAIGYWLRNSFREFADTTGESE